MQASRNIRRGIDIGVGGVRADLARERPLVRSVLSIHVRAATALLRRIGALDAGGRNSAFGRIPGHPLRNMTELRGAPVGLLRTRLEAHLSH